MNDPFNRSRLPQDFSREGRVALLGEAFEALMRGEMPSSEARMFLASAGMAWLQRGGSLERDYLKVVKPKSHHTPAHIWRQVQSESEVDEGRVIVMNDTPSHRGQHRASSFRVRTP